MTDRRTSLTKSIEVGIERSLLELHTVLPGIIQSFDTAEQLADVQIALKRKQNGELIDISLLTGVPVRFFKFGDFTINAPIKSGDEVAVFFIERSIDLWLERSGQQSPNDNRRHSLSDAFIIPMLYSQPNKITDFDPDNLEIRTSDGSGFISIKPDGTILLNGDADSAIAFVDMKAAFDQLKTELNNFITAYNTHNHPTAPTGPVSLPSVPGTAATADMSGAELPTIKVP